MPIYRINFSQIPKVVYIWLSHLKQHVYHNTHNETNKLTHNKEQSTPTVTVTENEGMNGETETEGDREPDVDDSNVIDSIQTNLGPEYWIQKIMFSQPPSHNNFIWHNLG